MKQLTEYYARLGYLAVRLTPEVVRTADLSRVKVVYHIEEGIQYQVAGVQIDGSQSNRNDKLQELLTLKAGQRYNESDVKRDLKSLEDYNGFRGYRTQAEKQIYQDPDNPAFVRVHYL